MNYIIKILTFWIPIKSWRKKCRNLLLNLLISYPFIIKMRKKYPDGVFLLSPHAGIGEFVQSLCLMKALKDKISKQIVIVTTKKNERDICNLYIDTVSCYYNPDIKIYETNPITNILEKGKIYPMYLLPKSNATKRSKDIDFLKDLFLLDQNVKIEKVIPNKPDIISDNFLELENILKNKKTIFIFPEANTYDASVVSDKLWIEIANKLQNKGYQCIFNSKKVFNGFLNVFLPVNETIYLSSLAYGIISFRSGLSELIALTTKCKMLVIYPNGTTHLFKKECNVSIDEFLKRIENFPLILSNPNNPIVSSFKIGSISENFDRSECKDYYYDFNNSDFINFILSEL